MRTFKGMDHGDIIGHQASKKMPSLEKNMDSNSTTRVTNTDAEFVPSLVETKAPTPNFQEKKVEVTKEQGMVNAMVSLTTLQQALLEREKWQQALMQESLRLQNDFQSKIQWQEYHLRDNTNMGRILQEHVGIIHSVIQFLQQQLNSMQQQWQAERETSFSILQWIETLNQRQKLHEQKMDEYAIAHTATNEQLFSKYKDLAVYVERKSNLWEEKNQQWQQELVNNHQKWKKAEATLIGQAKEYDGIKQEFQQWRQQLSQSLKTQDSNLKKVGLLLHRQQEEALFKNEQGRHQLQSKVQTDSEYNLKRFLQLQQDQTTQLNRLSVDLKKLEEQEKQRGRKQDEREEFLREQSEKWKSKMESQLEFGQQQLKLSQGQWILAVKGLTESLGLMKQMMEKEQHQLKAALLTDIEGKLEQIREEVRQTRPIIVM